VDALQDAASITATKRSEHALGKAMEVDSTSPDTGQYGSCARACSHTAHALSGKTVRALCWMFPFYENWYLFSA
jgi:hypothetical protein